MGNHQRAGLAQLVAHPTCNRKVAGSSPAAGPVLDYERERSRTVAIANTSEIAQLAHSRPTCQVNGPRIVRRRRPIPAAKALSIELLKMKARIPSSLLWWSQVQ